MSVNLDNDLSIYNATEKNAHPQGTELVWRHKGQELHLVYQQLRIAEVTHWCDSVRAFVKQVDEDAELRAKRDRELAEAEASSCADHTAVQEPAAPVTEGHRPSCIDVGVSPLQQLELQLADARYALRKLQEEGAELTRKIQAAEQHVAMLEAAVQAMKAVKEAGHDGSDQGIGRQSAGRTAAGGRGKEARRARTTKPASSYTRKKRAEKDSVQAASESASDPAQGV